jgi:hypothetical protein
MTTVPETRFKLERKYTGLNVLNILQNVFIRNSGIRKCVFCSAEHKDVSLGPFLPLVFMSLLLGKQVFVMKLYADFTLFLVHFYASCL